VETRILVLGKEHADTLSSIINLSSIYERQGRLSEAEDMMVEELKSRSKMAPNNNLAGTATLLNNLARLYGRQSRWKEAKTLMEEVVRIQDNVLGPKHTYTVDGGRFLVDIDSNIKKAMYMRFLYPSATRSFYCCFCCRYIPLMYGSTVFVSY
jgi:hypothetical protein